MKNKEEFSYDQSIRELESMVSKFEKAEIGVDELVEQVRRAGELIKACRNRLKTVEGEMKSAIEELENAGADQPQPEISAANAPKNPPSYAVDLEAPPVDQASVSALDDPFADDVPFDLESESYDAPKNPPKRSAPKSNPPVSNDDGGLFSL